MSRAFKVVTRNIAQPHHVYQPMRPVLLAGSAVAGET